MASQGKRAQTKENNRRIILDAARNVFVRNGYRTTTVRDIIGATSLASGTFYNYFKSKDDVFAALRDELARELEPALSTERRSARTAEEFFAGTFRAFLTHIADQPGSLAAINTREDEVSSSTRVAVLGGDDLRADIESAIARGLFAQLDAELLAAAVAGVAFEVADVMKRRQSKDHERAVRFCSQLMLYGIESPELTGRYWPI